MVRETQEGSAFMPPLKDLTGQRFGKLVVIRRAENIHRKAAWLCKCDCGNEKVVQSWNLVKGCTKSCGCLTYEVDHKTSITHGQSYTRLYTVWIGMKQRCYYKKHKHYADYGGRGIRVCDEWVNSFADFYEWANENGYNDSLTIDRIDSNGDYSPENCRWATYRTQNNNTRSNHFLTLNDETHTIGEWSKITGLPRTTIYNRIKRGWTTEDTLTKTP